MDSVVGEKVNSRNANGSRTGVKDRHVERRANRSRSKRNEAICSISSGGSGRAMTTRTRNSDPGPWPVHGPTSCHTSALSSRHTKRHKLFPSHSLWSLYKTIHSPSQKSYMWMLARNSSSSSQIGHSVVSSRTTLACRRSSIPSISTSRTSSRSNIKMRMHGPDANSNGASR
jgi:hypothetical protein